MSELENILGVNEKENSVESSDDKKPEGTKEEKDKLRETFTAKIREQNEVIETLKGELSQIKAKFEPAKTEEEPDTSTTEGWMKVIDKKSKDSIQPVQKELETLKERQMAKATRRFYEKHPEYAKAEPEKMKSLLDTYSRVKSRTEMDADDIFEDLEDSWAIHHRDEILREADAVKKNKLRAEKEMADVASSGSSGYEKSEEVEGASDSDYRIAKRINMPIKKYLELKGQLREAQISSDVD